LAESLTVVVPAYNEAANIGDCVASILASEPPCSAWRRLVVDDGSTDQTAALAEAALAAGSVASALLPAGPRPEGERWVGKNWACYQANRWLDQAGGSDWLLFLDADVRLEPGALRLALADHPASQEAGALVAPLLARREITEDRWLADAVTSAAAMQASFVPNVSDVPLPRLRKRETQAEALAVGAVLASVAFGLVLTTNTATVYLSFVALAVAVAYPYAKRIVSMPQAVLGVAFSFGIPMAFSAVQGTVPWTAVLLLVGNLFWVLAYDTEYAMVDRDDDLHIGIRTSAITLGRWDVAAVMFFYSAYLGIWAFLLAPTLRYPAWIAGLAVAAAQALWHYRLIRLREREGCFTAFRQNHWLGFAVFVGIALSLPW
jgi:4-hydroxybenzoate polyprenyltransferase